MTSLKGYTPGLARLLNTTSAALYERQRALARAGLLDVGAGRGPGSGVRATAPSVALILLSVLATDRLTESELRVRALAGARPSQGERCPYTGMTSLLDALAAILTGRSKAARFTELIVSRTADLAQINYRDTDGIARRSEFVGPASSEPGISIKATLSRDLLRQVARDVHEIVLEGSKT